MLDAEAQPRHGVGDTCAARVVKMQADCVLRPTFPDCPDHPLDQYRIGGADRVAKYDQTGGLAGLATDRQQIAHALKDRRGGDVPFVVATESREHIDRLDAKATLSISVDQAPLLLDELSR